MGMEDREWYREELRQKGKKPSWDNLELMGHPKRKRRSLLEAR